AIRDRSAARVERKPGEARAVLVRAEVDAGAPPRLGRDHPGERLAVRGERERGLTGCGNLVRQPHASNNSPVASPSGEPSALALRLFAPIAGSYDRYAALLSFGQDPRWRRFLVERVDAAPGDTVLDLACGTCAISLALARRYGCSVVGLDQSAEMLDEGRRRVQAAGVAG